MTTALEGRFMDSAWISPTAGLIGVLIGYFGSFYIQRRAFNRTDGGIRREIKSLLRLALEQIAPRCDIDRDRLPILWLPGFTNRITIVVDRARQPDVALAFDDETHFQIRRAVEQLQELLHRVRSDVEDTREIMRGSSSPLPSEEDSFTVQDTTLMEFNITCAAVSNALIALNEGEFVERLVPQSVWRVLPKKGAY